MNSKHIVSITESKPGELDFDTSKATNHYALFRHDRIGSRGERMAMCVHQSPRFKILTTSDVRDEEFALIS